MADDPAVVVAGYRSIWVMQMVDVGVDNGLFGSVALMGNKIDSAIDVEMLRYDINVFRISAGMGI